MELLTIIIYHVIIIINIKPFSLSVTRDPMIFLSFRKIFVHLFYIAKVYKIQFEKLTAVFFLLFLCIIFICETTFLLFKNTSQKWSSHNPPSISFGE